MPASTRFDQRAKPGRVSSQERTPAAARTQPRVERRDDHDLRRAEHEALSEHAAVRGIDELRKERELEQARPWG